MTTLTSQNGKSVIGHTVNEQGRCFPRRIDRDQLSSPQPETCNFPVQKLVELEKYPSQLHGHKDIHRQLQWPNVLFIRGYLN